MSSSSYADFYDAAEKEGNLNAGGSSELLPAGQYNGVVEQVKIDTPADGKKFGLRVRITEGPLAGKSAWANLNLKKNNPRGATAFFISCEKFGLTKDFFFRSPAPTDNEVASFFKDVPVTIEITHREWNDKTVQDGRIVSVNKAVGVPTAPVAPVPQVAPPLPAQESVTVAVAAPSYNPLGAPIN